MSLYKQVKKFIIVDGKRVPNPAYKKAVWWTNFGINDRRFRISLQTTDSRLASGREKEKIVQAQAGNLSTVSRSFARLAFSKAADKYLADWKLKPTKAETLPAKSSIAKESQLLVKLKERR